MAFRSLIPLCVALVLGLACDTSTSSPDSQPADAAVIEEDGNTPPAPGTVIDVPAGLEEGYIEGGLLASYHTGALAKPDSKLGKLLKRRIEEKLVFTKDDADFIAVSGGDLFHLSMEGGLKIEDAGRYRLIVFASDSVRIKLHDKVVAETWAAGDLVQIEATLDLKPGWHPFDIIYSRDMFRAHLQVWIGKEGEEPAPITAQQLGYTATPPDEKEEFKGEVELTWSSFYEVRGIVRTPWPTSFDINFTGGEAPAFHKTETYSTEQEFTAYLRPGFSYEGTFTARDLWGRTVSLEPIQAETPPVLPYITGGLLGHYHNGTNFNTLVATRIDPVIYMPEMIDGREGGSFGIYMGANNFSIRWEGAINIETEGEYTFYLGTDDGQRLFIDDEPVAQLWTGHALTYVTATKWLTPGWHPLTIEMFEGNGSAHAKFEWEGPGIEHEIVPSDVLGYFIPDGPIVLPKIGENEAIFVPANNNLDTPDGFRLRWHTSNLTQCEVVFLGQQHTFDTWSTSFSYDFYGVSPGNITVQIRAKDQNGLEADPIEVLVTIPEPEEDD